MTPTPDLSIVLPVHNEAPNLPLLWEELVQVLADLRRHAEIIFVDDASTDGSTEILRDLVRGDGRVRMLRFRAHAGLTAAFFAGLHVARAPVLATLDSDLQNDPRDLAILLPHLDAADAVVGSRVARSDPALKRISSKIGNAVRNAVIGEHVVDSACSLRVMRRECLDAFLPFDGAHRFLPTLLRAAGFRVVETPVHHRPRRFGRSNFGVRNRAVRAFVDLLAVAWLIRSGDCERAARRDRRQTRPT